MCYFNIYIKKIKYFYANNILIDGNAHLFRLRDGTRK